LSPIGQMFAAFGAWLTRPLTALNLALEARAARTAEHEFRLRVAVAGGDDRRALRLLALIAEGVIPDADVTILRTVGAIEDLPDHSVILTAFGRRVLADWRGAR
jgi:hypothetical protein